MALLAAGTIAAGTLSACGANRGPAVPAPGSAPDREWIDNAGRFVQTLNTDIGLTTGGGPTLASARRAMADSNDVYTMLVAYGLFGDCNHELANVGTPSSREGRVVTTLVAACGRLEHASALFQRAMTDEQPAALLAATRASLAAAPVLVRARIELAALRPS